MESESKTVFWDIISYIKENGNYHSDEIIAMILPLLKDIQVLHEKGEVADLSLENSILVREGKLSFGAGYSSDIVLNFGALTKILPQESNTFEVSEEYQEINEVGPGIVDISNTKVLSDDEVEISKPIFIIGYDSYETKIGHHDPLTDIFVCGLVLASLSFGLDFNEKDDIEKFADYRNKLDFLRSDIHPVISNIIVETTNLDRRKRPRDLSEIIVKLENYREYNPERNIDLTTTAGFIKQKISTRKSWILNKLKSRLFDISRRNKLLYFKSNMRFLNLTVSSVPNLLDYKNINPDNLFIWNDKISGKVVSKKDISLNQFLRFDDNPYIKSSLDKIRSEARKDINEYGFSQLKLVIAFLNWYNIKEDKNEKINSPLLLVPVDIVKKKGVQDQYLLKVKSNEAEVNPLLVYYFKELYGIELPDYIDLSEKTVEEFYEFVKQQVEISKSGVELVLMDKPRIKLIHTIAKQTLSSFNKRRRGRSGRVIPSRFNYSYDSNNYIPLGLQIYKKKVRPYLSYLEYLVNDDIKLSSFSAIDESTKRTLYTTENDINANPYRWAIDTCSITLGNFNYKKMTLVRDFNEIINGNIDNPIFDELFSDKPIQLQNNYSESTPIKDHYYIIESDPSQSEAIAMANADNGPSSYIIQGPPGTGKSQTITNLIADFIANNKRVLFICEKRAAVDVVFYRLKQKGLDQLSTRIHDSQGDKKDFIMNLKSTYFDFIENPVDFDRIKNYRSELIGKIEKELAVLDKFHRGMTKEDEDAGTNVKYLLERLVSLNKTPSKEYVHDEDIPAYKEWLLSKEKIEKINQLLNSYGYTSYSNHPISKVSDDIVFGVNPMVEIRDTLDKTGQLLDDINEDLDNIIISEKFPKRYSALQKTVGIIDDIRFLIKGNNYRLLISNSAERTKFDEILIQFKILQNKLMDIREKNRNWKTKLSEIDVSNALEQMIKFENSFLSFLSPTYRKLKGIVESHYDFSKHSVKPKYSQLLRSLKDEYDVKNKSHDISNEVSMRYKETDVEQMGNWLEMINRNSDDAIINYCKENPEKSKLVLEEVDVLNNYLKDASIVLAKLMSNAGDMTLGEIEQNLDKLHNSLDNLPDLLPYLNELKDIPDIIREFLKKYDFSIDELEVIIANKSLRKIYNNDLEFSSFNASTINRSVDKISSLYREFLKINAKYINAKVRKLFNQKIHLTEQSNSVLSQEEKEKKKELKAGRKILEREFNKKIRYKSIREIASSEAGELVKSLKPIWLMSPLSVSDTLPIDSNYFDVVIFDEASQINLEEGIPPFFRAKKTIIVGDEMQMPPTNFFNTTISEVDNIESEEEEKAGIYLDAESLLSQGARKMPSVMLKWHYRSKHEDLISFSNAAFYGRDLMTIPDKDTFNTKSKELISTEPEDAMEMSNTFLDRSISYHYMENGIYEKRSNLTEAEYIAYMVRELIRTEPDLSIGVVAFSQQQQSTIESALMNLAVEDPVFETELEAEYQKMDDDQFIGLFVKNLENVQGDERDIMILSICYGYNKSGKMLMNFGPINRKGGEKRLNVIFSRAKKHMAVVSSIHHNDIKNEYNEGANYFKRFLQYSESVSKGLKENAYSVLNSLTILEAHSKEKNIDIVSSQIAGFLRENGYFSELNIGNSQFRCNIAIKKSKEDTGYSLGILIDNDYHYQNENILEQYHQRPSVLRAFGWNILQIYIKDWYNDRSKVEKKIIDLLETEEIFDEFEDEENDVSLAGNSESGLPILAEVEEVAAAAEEDDDKVLDEQVDDNRNEGEIIDSESSEKDEVNSIERVIEFSRFELVNDRSNKFWEVAVDGNLLITRYGRIGNTPRTTEKEFDSNEKAEAEKQRVIRVKINKGYIEVKQN